MKYQLNEVGIHIGLYVNGGIQRLEHIDIEDPALISQSRYYLLEVFEEDNSIESGETYDIDMMHWLGYLYSYWNYAHEVTSKEILEMITPEDILKNYDVLHTQSNKYTLDWIYEYNKIYNQKSKN